MKKSNPAGGLTADAPPAILQLVRTYHRLAAAVERCLGVHPGRWRLLILLGRAGSVTQKELAALSGVHAGTVTRLVQDLERKRLVARESDPADQRVARVALTAAGREFVRRLLPVRAALIARGLEGIRRAELDQMEATLLRVERNLLAMEREDRAAGRADARSRVRGAPRRA